MLRSQFITSLSEISAEAWNHVSGHDYPFTRYEFLQALESSGAVSEKSGWLTRHCLIFADDELVAVMPSYVKLNSYGEFVFDFQWANAYKQYGLAYYPKLISAIPFTPATGPRLCVLPSIKHEDLLPFLYDSIKKLCQKEALSSWHILFPSQALSRACQQQKLMQRRAVHFQWRNQSFQSFDDFLALFSSRQRKNLRKERKRITEQGITIEIFSGAEISDALWEQFYHFYQVTYAKHSGHGGYLSQAFFQQLSQTLAEQVVLVMAQREGQYIAGALNFKSSDSLYGRYWGAIEEIDGLHFEVCYYQGIEYCIQHQLQHFDPGVQGEHKIKRGFEPSYTYSNHHIEEPQFSAAIAQFLIEEDEYIQQYKAQKQQQLPFKIAD